MVSLINFKIVNEELQERGAHLRAPQQQRPQESGQLYVRVMQHSQQQQQDATSRTTTTMSLQSSKRALGQQQQQACDTKKTLMFQQQQPPGKGCELEQPGQAPNFAVTWRNLKFAIEPKWHQRLVASGGRLASQVQGQQQQPPPPPPAAIESARATTSQGQVTKVVLDRLDGSFRSGELTAILGPSGAGKTTLLDCLTGRRKNGLSGSIRISSSTCHGQSIAHQLSEKCHFQQAHNSDGGGGGGGDHLKVSIIPQNDHLMGHLTVYETLNYASKMKNCFDKHFDHKLNIRRVAQQLGLMSCLATRINKLSGGQYKRVSIAQELLSSPDILILDEPTSGLDAMTCYQTVQVLRQLTDDRRQSGQKQIAVILTIHQPNSDVFQQFNHVYVVAQGGKCIYEGPPASIEQVINRVGIRLPSSYYNPATMIVEVAAGKFGLGAVQKLNSIQKKQYELAALEASNFEQNSTGDSAVDFPSSSSSNSDEDDQDVSQERRQAAELRASRRVEGGARRHRSAVEINNNLAALPAPASTRQLRVPADEGGLVNKGFVMEGENEAEIKAGADVAPAAQAVKRSQEESDQMIQAANSADSVDKIKSMMMMSANNNNSSSNSNDNNIDAIGVNHGALEARGAEDGAEDGRGKKRRRTRKRRPASELQVASLVVEGDRCARELGASGSEPPDGGGGGREKRLKLNSLKADQKFPFWRHTYLHFHRSWLSIVRDPLLCGMQLALHIIVPVMVSLVYGTNVGKPNACPRAGPMDIMAYALEPTDTALQLQEDFRTTLENIGYIFFKLYGIIFAAMTVTVLTFPLDMHVLVKEFRNGWYGLSSYFLGRTLADIPFQLTLPLLAMSLSYYATGQPYSYLQWRFLSITAILILSSLIAQSQGLLFGAILMDKMKAAVFVAPAATTPIILFAGFLVRTQSIPRYLRPLSSLSYLRYAIEACLISRYGFNQCECDPAIFNQTVPELPPIARSMLDYWLSSFRQQQQDSVGNLTAAGDQELATTTLAPASNPDLFSKLIDSLAKANSFGRNITSCEQVVPYPMIDYDLKDSQLFNCFAILLFMLLATRLLTFFIVCFKVKRKV